MRNLLRRPDTWINDSTFMSDLNYIKDVAKSPLKKLVAITTYYST